MPVIDADTHVIESDATWEYFEATDVAIKPYLTQTPDAREGLVNRWVIDGKLVPKPAGKGSQGLATPPIDGVDSGAVGDVTWAWRSLEDPVGRAKDAKERGVDVQVIFPTLFLADLTEDVELQVALSRSYNRFLGERWEDSGRVFRWMVVPPLRSIEATIKELKYGAEHGASGVMFHGIEIDHSLGDPYFYPVYKAAAENNLAVGVHTGPGSITMLNLQDSRLTRNFGHNRVLPLIGFHDLVFNRVPEKFPDLRIGFLEASSSWVPFLTHFFQRSSGRSGRDPAYFGPELFEDYRLYVAVETDEDIAYIAKYTGWDHLLIGSDYGHRDQSAEVDFITKLASLPDLNAEQRDTMLQHNPAVYYGLQT